MHYLDASAYLALDRGDRHQFGEVRRQLTTVVNSQPTQLRPEDREAWLGAIFEDLKDGGVWLSWSEDILWLAISAVKVLGRNPVGSGELMLNSRNFSTLVRHTGLLDNPERLGRGQRESDAPRESALEALRALANTLVLHPSARHKLARRGGADAIARALSDSLDATRLFLLCRIGFLVTADGTGVANMVDNENIVPRLVYHLHTHRAVPANYDALSELLKFTGNVLRTYPKSDGDWDSKLSPLLYPVLSIVHHIGLNDLVPPLTHALHALLHIPFTPELLPTWHAAPGSHPSASPRERTRGSIFGKMMNKGHGQAHKPGRTSPRTSPKSSRSNSKSNSPTSSRRGSLTDQAAGTSPPLSSSPDDNSEMRTHMLAPRTNDPEAFPRRLLHILTGFVDAHLPGTGPINPELQIDELLPPVLLLGAHAATGSAEMRKTLRTSLFPSDLDRSPEAGPLETRAGLLGWLLRLLEDTHVHCRDTAGEFLWAVCGADASELCAEVGYGLVAGLLFRKGINSAPPAKIVELDDDEPKPKAKAPADHEPHHTHARNPITALDDHPDPSPLAGMSEEEMEREAERMFVLFDRMQKNPVLSASAPTADGGTQSLADAMRDQVAAGTGERWEQAEAERERARMDAEEEEEEREAMRELAAYKARRARHHETEASK